MCISTMYGHGKLPPNIFPTTGETPWLARRKALLKPKNLHCTRS